MPRKRPKSCDSSGASYIENEVVSIPAGVPPREAACQGFNPSRAPRAEKVASRLGPYETATGLAARNLQEEPRWPR